MSRLPALVALMGLCAPAAASTTFSVDYVVRISSRDPSRAQVHWLLSGIDEIERLRLVFRDERSTNVQGTGRLEWNGRTCHWTPGRPYAHLRYTVAIDRRRSPSQNFDSHADKEWIATRALHLFPEINVTFRNDTGSSGSRARLIFRLPRGWRTATALERLDDGSFRVEEPGKRFDRPRGWFLLGRVARYRRTIAGSDVTIALAPGSTLDPRPLFRLYEHTMPLLAELLGPPPPRMLVVSAPDPMWHGGLSGEDSFFVSARIPLRSPDRTSTYLHELFHVWQPFRPGPDGHWIAEGLAEYYSLALPFRAGRLSARGFARGLALFDRYGRWDIDLSRTRVPAALNNSAPLVMHWIDEALRRTTEGRHSLDDAVRLLARTHTRLTTASFLSAVNRIAGKDFTPLFRRHVFRGARPPVTELHAAIGH